LDTVVIADAAATANLSTAANIGPKVLSAFTPPLLALVRALNALAVVEIRQAELADTHAVSTSTFYQWFFARVSLEVWRKAKEKQNEFYGTVCFCSISHQELWKSSSTFLKSKENFLLAYNIWQHFLHRTKARGGVQAIQGQLMKLLSF
jgi:hypothetical protein